MGVRIPGVLDRNEASPWSENTDDLCHSRLRVGPVVEGIEGEDEMGTTILDRYRRCPPGSKLETAGVLGRRRSCPGDLQHAGYGVDPNERRVGDPRRHLSQGVAGTAADIDDH